MTNPVTLRNVEHQHLRVISEHGARYGDAVMFAITFPSEFRDVQANYPIVFRKTDDGLGFEPVALFGFQEGENLFLGPNSWDANYVPLAVRRQPFLIGVDGGQVSVGIDLDSPRVSATEGEPLFLDNGSASAYLERASSMLLAIHEGMQAGAGFMAALVEHELLESFALDVELVDGSQGRMMGFYAIHEENLGALPGAALERLQRAGHLQAMYMAVASLVNLRDLVARKNRAVSSTI